MSDARIKVRANRSTGELEVEGPSQAVAEWWEKLWPELAKDPGRRIGSQPSGVSQTVLAASENEDVPEVFGEYFTAFPSDISDVDKVLVAGAFAQNADQERSFTTQAANQLLLDQNVKVANASENVRRLIQAKCVFVISQGRYRVSTVGFERLNSIKVSA